MRSGVLVAAVTVLALTGCSGGGGEDSGSDGPGGPSAPTEAEYAEAHELFHDLSDVFDDASQAAADFQAAVKKVHEQDPEGFRDSPEVTSAIEEQDAAVAARDEALAELSDHPAMADEELATAWGELVSTYETAMTYQDGFNDSYPAFLASGEACMKVFGAGPDSAASVQAYAREWLQLQRRAAQPCLQVNEELAESANEDVAAVAARWERLIEERRTAITRMAEGKVGDDPTARAIRKLNDDFVADYEELTGFSERLGELYPSKELFDAVDVIFKDRDGGSEEPADETDETGEPAESESS